MTTFSTGTLMRRPSSLRPGLDRDAVVAGVERAVLDQHVAARLGIAAVVVRAVAADRYAADGDVLAEHRVDLPHRRVDDRHALDEHVAAAIGLDEIRPQVVARAEDALGDRHALGLHLDQPVARRAGRGPDCPGSRRRQSHQCSVVRLAVERAVAGDRDVLRLEGVDERRVVHQLDAFPPGEDDRVLAMIAS